MKNFNRIFLLGDIHGRWGVIPSHLTSLNEKEVLYIQVGDFGIGFYTIEREVEKLKKLNDILVENLSFLYIIRGNHDNPAWFKNGELDKYKNELSNIKFIPDYTVLNINSENILFVGGAVSIDRKWRAQDISWWLDEVVTFDFDFVKNLRDIDRIICHTSPDFCPPTGFNGLVYDFAKSDLTLLDDLKYERSNMTKLVTDIMVNNKIKSFFYGHFHSTYRFYHNNCDFICLNINEFFEL